MKKQKNTNKDVAKIDALKQLKNIMRQCHNKRCFTIVNHVSSTGMSRVIHFVAITKRGGVYCLDGLIHKITGYKFDNSYNGLRVYGCGMDMIFNTLYVLNSYARNYNIIKPSKKHDAHDIQYNGVINTSYNYF